jgi:kynurenine formamidase
MTIARDGAAVQTLSLASHTGTHIDAPRHVTKDGLTIGDFGREAVRLPLDPVAADRERAVKDSK